jgi:alpha-1,3-rhamnosyl/mannosyltransferase
MIKVGFGVSALAKGLAGGGIDGIGNYTLEMLRRLEGISNGSVSDTDTLYAAPIRLFPFAFGSEVPSSLTEVPGVSLGRYSLSAAFSVFTGLSSPGINTFGKQVDLIHATDHYVPKCSLVPVVATLMDAIPLSHPHWLRDDLRGLKNALWKRAAGWADAVITISEYSKIELSKWCDISLDRITVIPLAVDERWYNDVASVRQAGIREKYKLPQSYFVSVGTLQPRKNLAAVIQAHRSLTPAERLRCPLVIVGRAGWKCEDVLALIEEESASGSVRWLQHVPADDLLPVVKMARGMLFPSLAEGFGLPVLEAFAAQVPVITSTTTSLPEVAGDAALSIDPSDINAMSNAMRQLIENDVLHADLVQRGFARAKQFTWDTCATSTLALYNRVLGRSG